MNPPSIQTVLTNLISLTNERDVYQLELLLAQSLYDLIQPINNKSEKAVVVYRPVNVKKQQFNSVVIGKTKQETLLGEALKSALTECFEKGEFVSFANNSDSELSLYPLKNTANRTMAVIAIEAAINDEELHDTITMLLQIHQNFAGLIRDNEHDTLTGLLNRKSLDAKLNKVIEQKRSSAKRAGDKANAKHFLALLDIDRFKKINDEHGHLVGDEVLKSLSGLIKNSFREKDMLFRYGGEEFLGIFECANLKDITQLLERFRNMVSQHAFNEVGNVTISIGFTQINADDALEDIVNRADLALYYAKEHGRNCLHHYESLLKSGKVKAIEPALLEASSA